MKYLLASQGVFRTIQGEGVLAGTPMTFVRFAGCSVGCPECDTDYKAVERVGLNELVQRIVNTGPNYEWVWLTGGEPTDQDLDPLVQQLDLLKYNVAIATAGTRKLTSRKYGWISVSPHSTDLKQTSGHEIKIVPGLNGMTFEKLKELSLGMYAYKFIQPLWEGQTQACIDFVLNNPGWRLTIQAHKYWNIP